MYAGCVYKGQRWISTKGDDVAQIIDALCGMIIMVLCTPLGWIGMIILFVGIGVFVE